MLILVPSRSSRSYLVCTVWCGCGCEDVDVGADGVRVVVSVSLCLDVVVYLSCTHTHTLLKRRKNSRQWMRRYTSFAFSLLFFSFPLHVNAFKAKFWMANFCRYLCHNQIGLNPDYHVRESGRVTSTFIAINVSIIYTKPLVKRQNWINRVFWSIKNKWNIPSVSKVPFT